MLWILRVYNMSFGILYALWSIHNMEGYECKMCPNITHLFLENMNEAKGGPGDKIRAILWY
jgi:hypothetical protein